MAYVFAPVPYFACKVRREFTVNLKKHHGDYLDAVAVGVRMQRGLSLYFQTWLMDGYGAGAMFLLPIQALVMRECAVLGNAAVQPWDVFSPDFTVARLDLFHRSRMYQLPERKPGRYMMTFDFTGNELADDLEQHKHLHLCALDEGQIIAVPNNRLLVEDPAFIVGGVTKERPDFVSLATEFYAE